MKSKAMTIDKLDKDEEVTQAKIEGGTLVRYPVGKPYKLVWNWTLCKWVAVYF